MVSVASAAGVGWWQGGVEAPATFRNVVAVARAALGLGAASWRGGSSGEFRLRRLDSLSWLSVALCDQVSILLRNDDWKGSLEEASVEVVLVGEKGVRDQRSQSVRRDGRREGWGRRRAITEAKAFKLLLQLCVLLH